MFVLFAIQVALGLFVTSHKNYIGSYISDIFEDSLYKYTNETRTQKTFDIIQHDVSIIFKNPIFSPQI